MTLSFHRRYEFQARIQNKIRAFSLQVGYQAPLNLETGMTVSLPGMDAYVLSLLDRLNAAPGIFKDLGALGLFVRAGLLSFSTLVHLQIEPIHMSGEEVGITWSQGAADFHYFKKSKVQVQFLGQFREMILTHPEAFFIPPDALFNLEELTERSAQAAERSAVLDDRFCFEDPTSDLSFGFSVI